MAPKYTKATCPECNTTFDRVPVDGDEDGLYACIEVTPCADPTCGKLLCADCAQFHSGCCGQIFCADHLVLIEDGTDKPLQCCAACAAECEPLPAAIPPQRETRTAVPLAAPRCPECLSTEIVAQSYDYGMDTDTGYRDAGEQFRCLACGEVGDAEDVLVSAPRVTRMPAAREIAAAMLGAAEVA